MIDFLLFHTPPVQVMGVEPIGIFSLRNCCPSTVASLAFERLVGLEPTTHGVESVCSTIEL